MTKLPIKDLKEFILFGINVGNGWGKAMEDGKLSFTDIQYLLPVLTSAGAAFDGFGNVLPQFKDMDVAELAEIKVFIGEKLDIPQDNIERLIEAGLNMAINIYTGAKEIMELLAKKD